LTAGLLNEVMRLKAENKSGLGPTKDKSAPAMKRNCTCLDDPGLCAKPVVPDIRGQSNIPIIASRNKGVSVRKLFRLSGVGRLYHHL
jgi:hypothetical protein